MEYKGVYEININANSPLEAAKMIEEFMRDSHLQIYIQENEECHNKLFSVDLEEEDEDAVLPVEEYTPMIRKYSKEKMKKK